MTDRCRRINTKILYYQAISGLIEGSVHDLAGLSSPVVKITSPRGPQTAFLPQNADGDSGERVNLVPMYRKKSVVFMCNDKIFWLFPNDIRSTFIHPKSRFSHWSSNPDTVGSLIFCITSVPKLGFSSFSIQDFQVL